VGPFAILGLLAATVVPAATPPKVQPVSLPRTAIVGQPWRAVVSIRPGARASIEARGASILRAPLRRTKHGRYKGTLRFPGFGTWVVYARVGKRAVRLRSVAVDIRRDPLVLDPIAIAAEPSGSILVGQQRRGGLLRVSGGRATRLVDMTGVFSITLANGAIYAVAGEGAVYRLEGSTLVQVTPVVDAGSVAVDAEGNMYVSVYAGWIRKVTPAGTVTPIAGDGTEGFAGDGGPALQAKLFHPHAIVLGHDGALYVADTENRRLRRIDLESGRITSFGGAVGLTISLAVGPDGSIYSADVARDGEGGGVTRTTPGGTTTRVVSAPDVTSVAVAPDGTIYVDRWERRRIERVDADRRTLIPVVRG